MNVEDYREYCISKKSVTEGFPFSNASDLLVFKVEGKMFTATEVTSFTSISVKCDPEMVDELRATYEAVKPPSYLSKRHWNRIVMDNSIPDKLIYQWIDDSYNLVIEKLPKLVRKKFGL